MSLPNNPERLTYEPAQSEAAAGIVGYNLDNLENRQARREFLTYLGAMRYESLSPAEQGRLDGMMAAQRRLNETLYHYNFHGGEIAEGARQLEDALKGLADIFGSAPDAVWGQPANQAPYRRQRTVEGIRSVARDIANDPDEARRIAEAARQAREQQEAAQRAAEETRARNIESAGLNRNQATLLSAPKLKITSVIVEVQKHFENRPAPTNDQEEIAQNDESMALFKEKLVDKLMLSVDDWLAANQQYAQGPQVEDSSRVRKEAWKAEGFDGHFDVALAGDALNLGVDGLKGIMGNLGGLAGNSDLDNFPQELGAIFQTQEDYQKFFALLKDDSRENKAAIRTLIGGKVEELFPTGSSFTGVEQMFAAYNVPDDELTPDQLDDIIGKLQRIPKYFRHFQSDLVEEYERYLRSPEGAAGPGAIEFRDWVMQRENLGMFQRIIFNLVFSFPGIADWLTGWFDGAESDKSEAEKRGATLHKYMELKETATGAESTEDGSTETVNDSPQYIALKAKFEAVRADPALEMNITVAGKPLETVEVTNEQKTQMSRITDMLNEHPQAHKLMSKGVDLGEIFFVAEHLGGNHADGIDMSMDDVSLTMRPDINQYLAGQSGFWNSVDSTGTGLGASIMAGMKTPGHWAFKLGAAVAAGFAGSMVGDRLGKIDAWGTGTTLSLDDLGAASLASAIKESKEDVGLIEEKIQQISAESFQEQFSMLGAHFDKFDFDSPQGVKRFPAEIFEDGNAFSRSLSKLMDMPSSGPNDVWKGYKMTQEDIDNFVKNQDGFWGMGKIDRGHGAFHLEDGQIENNGSGLFSDDHHPTVKHFFDSLRS